MASRVLGSVRSLARHQGFRGSATALLIYVLVTLLFTYPVPFRLNSVIAGFSGRDGWQYTWWLWFARRLLLEGRGLADLYLLNYPVGLNHPFQWSLVYLSILAVPLGSVFSPAATFNLMVLMSFPLSGLAAYHLCREQTQSHWAAVVGGLVFAFAPSRLGHAMAGWLPQMTVYLYPWYALLLIRILRQPTLKRAVLLGVVGGVGATVYVMHVVYFLLPLTIVIVGVELARLRARFFSQSRGRFLAMAFSISIAIGLPPMLPLVVERLRGTADYLLIPGVVGHSADLLAYFTPSPYHPVLARLDLVPAFAQRVFPNEEMLRSALAYPGLVVVVLALNGILRGKPKPWAWITLALSAALLSLGPVLVVGGQPLEYTVDGHQANVLLPYALLRAVPLLDWGRTPGRLNALAMLALGVLAAIGVGDLLARLSGSKGRAGMIVFLVIVLTLFEFVPIWPFPVGEAVIPGVIEQIADQDGEGAVLHLPVSRRRVNHRSLYFQTAIDRPIVGGLVHRLMPEILPWRETIEELAVATNPQDAVPRPSEDQRRAWLRHFGVDWILLHRLEAEDEAQYRPRLESLLGPAAVEDEGLIAFRVAGEESVAEGALLYTFGEQGWHPPELDGGLWRRWMYDAGELYVYSSRDEVGALHLTLDSHLEFPLLEVYHQDQLLESFVVGERTSYRTRQFILTQGMNVFRFHAAYGCPDLLDDPRCWSSALLQLPPDPVLLPCEPSMTCRTIVLDQVSFVSDAVTTTDINFGDQLRLRDWSLSETMFQPGDVLRVVQSWEALAEMSDQYIVFVHLVSADGAFVAQHDFAPAEKLPTYSAWPPGSVFGYSVEIELPADLPPGDYRLLGGVYLWPSLDRLPVLAGPPGVEHDIVELGTVSVVR